MEKKESQRSVGAEPETFSDCFGSYMSQNSICAKWCSIRLRCAVERDHLEQLEIMENMFEEEVCPVLLQ